MLASANRNGNGPDLMTSNDPGATGPHLDPEAQAELEKENRRHSDRIAELERVNQQTFIEPLFAEHERHRRAKASIYQRLADRLIDGRPAPEPRDDDSPKL
jgi:hypothetical protein